MISLCMSLKSVAAVESLIKNKKKKLASRIEMPNVHWRYSPSGPFIDQLPTSSIRHQWGIYMTFRKLWLEPGIVIPAIWDPWALHGVVIYQICWTCFGMYMIDIENASSLVWCALPIM
jgi:hypothetical protein